MLAIYKLNKLNAMNQNLIIITNLGFLNGELLTDDQIKCSQPIGNPGVVIDDETPDVDEYNYGSSIK